MITKKKKKIGSKHPTFIIAEAGVNHNGDLKLAKKLVDKAVEAEVDAIKFQTFKTENLVSKQAPKANYQVEKTNETESQFEMLKKLELSLNDHRKLKKYCKKKDILLLSTPFDFDSVDIIEDLGLPLYKVGSGDTNNLPLLEYIAQKNKPIILSTGMSDLSDVEEAVDTILGTGNDKLILLHCVSNYPANYSNINLRALDTLKQSFQLPVGYSDHTLGIEIPTAAVARGAVIIEKHFTLDKNMEGPDHQASLGSEELKQLVNRIRHVEKALGTGVKKPAKTELKNIEAVRKSLVVSENIDAGEVITKDKIKIKRPGTGIEPKFLEIIIGKKAKCDLTVDHLLKWGDVMDE